MKALVGKTAVVTGGASGIGLALAERFAREKMSLVIADIEQGALDLAVEKLRGLGASVLPVRVDVSDFGSVRMLSRVTIEAFGVPHILVSNAGVGGGAGGLETIPLEDWQWALNVNLYGSIHCLKAFLGAMKQRDEEAHIVFTASTAGLMCQVPRYVAAAAPQIASKYALVGLAEATFYQLAATKIGVSCLCPTHTDTNILTSDRNRPGGPRQVTDPRLKALYERAVVALKKGQSPAFVAEQVLLAIQENRFWVLPDPRVIPSVKSRSAAIAGEGPMPSPHDLDEPE